MRDLMDSLLDIEIIGISIIIIFIICFIVKKYNKKKLNHEQIIEKEMQVYVPPDNLAMLPAFEQLLHKMRMKAKYLDYYTSFHNEALNLWEISKEGKQALLVLVMGEFKTGKSTFINTILGDDILKTDAAPATAVVSVLRYGKEKKVKLHHNNGHISDYDFDKLADITAEGDDSKQVLRDKLDYVEIFYPNEILKKINLVDTPGLNVHKEKHIKNTVNFQEKADVVLWVFNAVRSATRTELAEIEALGKRLKPFAIVNRIDNIDEEEESIEEVLASVRRRIGNSVQDVIGLSAYEAQQAILENNDERLKTSGWLEFREKLNTHFVEQAKTLKIKFLKEKIDEFIVKIKSKFVNCDAENTEKEKYFADQNTAEESVLKNIQVIKECISYINKTINQIKEVEAIYNNQYKTAQLNLINEGNKLAKLADELLDQINSLNAFEDLGKDNKDLVNITNDIQMLNDEHDKLFRAFQSWFNWRKELIAKNNELANSKAHINELQRDYDNSGLFGGKPIFDFSGRRERLNNAIKEYNEDIDRFNKEVESAWSRYKSNCLAVIELNRDIVKVEEKILKIANNDKKNSEEKLVKLRQNFKKEKEQFEKEKESLIIAKNLIKELEREMNRIV